VLTAANALAAATASLVRDYDMVGTLSHLCDDCSEVLGATTAGIMLTDGNGPLEMMAASSHRPTDIELYEIQAGQGPCIEAAKTGTLVIAGSADEIMARWPDFGPRAVAAGFLAAVACPLRWHGDVIGAINIFLPAARFVTDDEQRMVQAFADVATIAIIHAGLPPTKDLARIARRALAARTIIEQAKGVVAAQTGYDMAASFDHLRALAEAHGQLLETFAQDLVKSTTRKRPSSPV
jgi:transcriptional regulator with GAF, ATPase, and Fis domain